MNESINSTLSNVKIYQSLDELSDRFTDYLYVFIIPCLSIYGITTSLISIYISAKEVKKDKGVIFKYMLSYSISLFIILLLLSAISNISFIITNSPYTTR
mgnify:CR=1 FL=1